MGDYNNLTYITVMGQVVSRNGGNFANEFIDNEGKYSFLNTTNVEDIRDTLLNPTRTGYTFGGYQTEDGTILFKYDRHDMSKESVHKDFVDGARYNIIWYDLESPTLDTIDISNDLNDTQSIYIQSSDTGSGVVGYYVGKISPLENDVNFTSEVNYTINSDGTWYIASIDAEGNIACETRTFKYITFDANKGNSANTVSISKTKKLICIDNNDTFGELPIPAKEGYNFLGWYNGNSLVTSETLYNKNAVTLKAKWELLYEVVGETSVDFDRDVHSMSAVCDDNNVKITYSIDNKNYTSNVPEFKDVGTYTVYYKLTIDDIVETGSYTLIINKVVADVIVTPTGVDLTYDGTVQTLGTAGATIDGAIYYKLGIDGAYDTEIPTEILDGTYTIYWYVKGDKNHYDSEVFSYTSIISPLSFGNIEVSGYSGLADGLSHSGTVSCDVDDAVIQYSLDNVNWTSSIINVSNCGTTTIYYKITKAGYTSVTGNFDIILNHVFDAKEISNSYLKSKATCETKAVYYYKCHYCNEKSTTTYEYGEALGHDYSASVNGTKRTDATCTKAATYYNRCIRCSAETTDYHSVGEALGHDYSASVNGTCRTNATCTLAATYYNRCTRCSEQCSEYHSYGKALGHSSSAKLVSNATCSSAAVYKDTCNRSGCGATTRTNYTSGSALGHNMVKYACSSGSTATMYLWACSRCLHHNAGWYSNTGTSGGSTYGKWYICSCNQRYFQWYINSANWSSVSMTAKCSNCRKNSTLSFSW